MNVKKCIAAMTAAAMVMISSTALAAGVPFTDVRENAYYTQPLEYCYNHKYVNGVTATTFEPESPLTRAQFVQMLYNVAGDGAKLSCPFTDVGKNKWYTNAVSWAYYSGIVKGTSATTFSPEDEITREQLVTLVCRFEEYCDVTLKEVLPVNEFADFDTVSPYAKAYVNYCSSAAIVKGFSDNTFRPKAISTRAEAVTILFRVLENDLISYGIQF